MRVTFVSNYYNHHQHLFCQELSGRCEEFNFISTSVMREERRQMGYDGIEEPSYVIHGYESSSSEMAKGIILGADVVICGAAQGEFAEPSLYRGKKVFYYSERLFKNNLPKWQLPLKAIRYHNRFERNQNSFLLCSGAYTAADFAKTGTFRNKCLKWGYFPEAKKYNISLLLQHKDAQKLLWCGRFLDWKHPEYAIEVANRLERERIPFSLDIIGAGEKEEVIRDLISEYGLQNKVKLLGTMSPQKVREQMERSGVFLFTSDRQEGWGAVTNEAMNSGCAVVASHAIGSVPYLIRNGKNGLIYKDGDVDMLYRSVKKLLLDPNLQREMGQAAYETIASHWNPQIAAERFYNVARRCIDGEDFFEVYQNGPLSRADLLGDNWF